jgi:hypothetical protein
MLSVVVLIATSQFATFALVSKYDPTRAQDVIKLVNIIGNALTLILSFFSSLWLVLVWILLLRFPREGIPPGQFAVAVAVMAFLTSISFAVATVAPSVAPSSIPISITMLIVDIIDSLISTSLLSFTGIAFLRIVDGNRCALVGVFGFLSGIMAVILSSINLPDKPEFTVE